MANKPTRREVLIGGASALAAAGLTTTLPGANKAFGAQELTVVEWGGPYLEAMKAITEKDGGFDVTWELHAGGSAAILPKIKSQWPDNLVYDIVAGWTPVFISMVREGWAATVNLDNVPNLANVPEGLITKDDAGNWKNVPRNTNAAYFGYREDLCPIEITSVEDFLDPKLKGQICWPDPFYGVNIQMIMLAVQRGGDEFNMEEGWKFMKELARSGNIGRVFKTETDVLNSLSTGETSVAHANIGNFVTLGRKLPIRHLTKVPNSPGLKPAIVVEGWSVLNGDNTQAAFDFANMTISAENNEFWGENAGLPPTNSKAKVPDELLPFVFTDEELAEFAFFPDWDYVSKQTDGWVKRFEQEIVPLL